MTFWDTEFQCLTTLSPYPRYQSPEIEAIQFGSYSSLAPGQLSAFLREANQCRIPVDHVKRPFVGVVQLGQYLLVGAAE